MHILGASSQHESHLGRRSPPLGVQGRGWRRPDGGAATLGRKGGEGGEDGGGGTVGTGGEGGGGEGGGGEGGGEGEGKLMQ